MLPREQRGPCDAREEFEPELCSCPTLAMHIILCKPYARKLSRNDRCAINKSFIRLARCSFIGSKNTRTSSAISVLMRCARFPIAFRGPSLSAASRSPRERVYRAHQAAARTVRGYATCRAAWRSHFPTCDCVRAAQHIYRLRVAFGRDVVRGAVIYDQVLEGAGISGAVKRRQEVHGGGENRRQRLLIVGGYDDAEV